MTRIAVLPGCLALLSEYASIGDPVAELRTAAQTAVAWLGAEVDVIGSAQGRRVAEDLLTARTSNAGDENSVLVVLNGSACRTEKAPGYLDPRAEEYDKALGAALTAPDVAELRAIDLSFGSELWADVAAVPELTDLLSDAHTVSIDFDDAPFGVEYWVLRWERER